MKGPTGSPSNYRFQNRGVSDEPSVFIRINLGLTNSSILMGDGNYNVKMESGEGSDGKKYVVVTIEDIDADFGDSNTGKTRKVAFGRVWFKDSRGNTVKVQLNANRNK